MTAKKTTKTKDQGKGDPKAAEKAQADQQRGTEAHVEVTRVPQSMPSAAAGLDDANDEAAKHKKAEKLVKLTRSAVDPETGEARTGSLTAEVPQSEVGSWTAVPGAGWEVA